MIRNLSVTTDKGIKLNKKKVHQIVKELSKELNFEIEALPINFVNSEVILDINRKYLKHDRTTDIITFNYSGNNHKLDGEIFISYKDGESNAEKYGTTPDNEILRLIIHGILHLLGYDDIEKNDKKVMKRLENKLVKSYNYLAEEIIKL